MPHKLRLVLPYAVMLAAAGFLYWAAARIDVETGGRISPAFWPKAVIVVMALLCAYEIAKRLFFGSARDARGVVAKLQAAPGAAEPAAVREERAPEHPGMLAAGVALVVGYVLLVPWTGFFLTTAVFLGVFPWAGGLRRPLLASTLGIAGSFVLVVVFMRVAYISLPLGEGPFRAVSLGLMRLIGVT